jgi:hypothetical protein
MQMVHLVPKPDWLSEVTLMPMLLRASWTLHHLRALALEDLCSSASLHAVAGAVGALMFQQPFFKAYHKNANFGFVYQLMPTGYLGVTKTPGCTYINRSMANLMHPSAGFLKPPGDFAMVDGLHIPWTLVFGDFMNQQLKALNLFYVASWHFMLMTCWGCGNPNSETYHKAEAELKQSFNFRTWQKALRILYPYDT